MNLLKDLLLQWGGTTVLIVGLSTWLGKIWANRILSNEKNEFQKELEFYKTALQVEIVKVNHRNEKAMFVSKLQYEKEYNIYLEISEKLFDCVLKSLSLFQMFGSDDIKEHQKKVDEFAKSINSYTIVINRYAPFYQKRFDDMFFGIRKDCYMLGHYFKTYKIDIHTSSSYMAVSNKEMPQTIQDEVYGSLPDSINQRKDKLRDEIKAYLDSLQTIE